MENQNTKIYIAMHEPNDLIKKIPYSYYIPIHAGKENYKNNKEGFLPILGDNTKDNISRLNPYYSELTVMYWIWKNDNSKPDDIIGLNHYRRYFAEDTNINIHMLPESERFDYLLTKESMNKILNEYDFIVRSGPIIVNLTNNELSVYEMYKNSHIIEDLDYTLFGIKELYPNLYPIIEKEIKETAHMYSANMFITKKKYFDEYCNFLFSILFYIEKYINLTDEKHSDVYQKRVFGFLAERLLKPWLIANNYKVIKGNQLNLNTENGIPLNETAYIFYPNTEGVK